MNTIVFPIILLASIGGLSGIILYYISQKFRLFEDPRIKIINSLLPGANCGECGYAGCRNFAETIVNKETIEGFYCTVGGNDSMKNVAEALGVKAEIKIKRVAVVNSNTEKKNTIKKTHYDGSPSCKIVHAFYSGEEGSPNGCLGYGDCQASCSYNAILMNAETGLPEINEDKCTSCNACVISCPRQIIELRDQESKNSFVFVSSINIEKGNITNRNTDITSLPIKNT